MGELDGVALITAVWGAFAYLMLPWGPTAGMTKMSPSQIKFGDRSFMNLIEQAPLFLSSLWVHAFFVSADAATTLGWTYVIFRFFYPIIWLVKAGPEPGYPMPAGFIVTFPCYGIVMFMYLATIAKLGMGMEFSVTMSCVGALVITFVMLAYAIGLCPIFQTKVFKPFFDKATMM